MCFTAKLFRNSPEGRNEYQGTSVHVSKNLAESLRVSREGFGKDIPDYVNAQSSGESSESDDSIDSDRNRHAEDRVVSAGEVARSDLRAASTASEKEEDEDSEDEVEVMEAPMAAVDYHAQAGLYTEQLADVLERSEVPSLTSIECNRFSDEVTGYYVQVSLQLCTDVQTCVPATHVPMSVLLQTLARSGNMLFPVVTNVILVPENCIYSMRIRCSRIATGL